MSTKILDLIRNIPSSSPLTGCGACTIPPPPRSAFRPKTVTEAEEWQRQVRPALHEAVGFTDLPAAPLDPVLIERVDRGDHLREKWLLQTWQGALMPVYLVLPKGRPAPTRWWWPSTGTATASRMSIGLWEDGAGTPHPGRLPQGLRARAGPPGLCRGGPGDLLLRRAPDRFLLSQHPHRPAHPRSPATTPPAWPSTWAARWSGCARTTPCA